ncbi:aminoglycoside phosphotransferase [Streptomyces sp. NWU339]|uniref:phosphotransferase n=1 Tax=Streptomyces sp. NWU339 TaxID=2185284 RepID=UPI000D6755D2|nr:phosphotransferase [Streptomyces sp. NWU339]PWI12011.1 aminoglycoside phosphotransferase [Streptomyces sp. NWU339]
MNENTWRFVKKRTTANGAVYVSADKTRYRRTGGAELQAEAQFQRRIADLNYPVPHVLEEGVTDDGHYYIVEESLGDQTLHERAVASLDGGRDLADDVTDTAAQVAARLLRAQAAHRVQPTPGALRQWLDSAGFTHNVFQENPDLDNTRTHAALDHALDRLGTVPLARGHLDYGLPNVLPAGVIDWQHHGLVPLGYDVLPALEIIAFKGGNKGYTASPGQRHRYLAVLDDASLHASGQPVSQNLGAYLLVKALFFLALMRPTDPSRTDKHLKWQYRRHLFTKGLEQYERTGTVDTALFPGLKEFAAGHSAGDHP